MEITRNQQQSLARLGVILCYAHGSVARGTPMRESDLDIAVLFAEMPQRALTAITEVSVILSDLAPKRNLDIAILNEAGPLFSQCVATSGLLLYARSKDDRVQFEVDAMHEYEASRRIHKIAFHAVMARPVPI